jgi:hypothetical protein
MLRVGWIMIVVETDALLIKQAWNTNVFDLHDRWSGQGN